ncbi:MAG: heparan-alpha-glucosaminide N-acetyltransferase domain-containing protein [Ferruginibacter sp.]
MEQKNTYRVTSIDILRGLVMIIMALDHTRDFFHSTGASDDPTNLATTTVPLFFTRWITHFCAPTFVFLSGTSAFLASKNKTPASAGSFLVKRGLWLVLVEIVIITFGITFNPTYSFVVFQVIWAIGWSMVLLGLLMRFPLYAVLTTGAILFFGHNLFDHIINIPQNVATGNLMKILFTASPSILQISDTRFIGVFYAVLPWTGVMLLGYCAGYWFRKEFSAVKRKQLLLTTGLSLIVFFIILRYFNGYGDPAPWDKEHFLSFLKTSKYPPSLLYLCMTLGPALVALSLLENVHTKWSAVATVYGRVPFFYYVLHFYLLHLLLVIIFFATGHGSNEIIDTRVPFLFRPFNFGFRLAIVYAIWLSIVSLLYLPCRWFNQYKKTHSQWWLSYV